MKKILGLDLGTTSIGWALVNEAESPDERSSIIRTGVRVNPLTVDEQTNFEKGRSITSNADRTLKRSMRRNLQRYKLRRNNLIAILKLHKIIGHETILSEQNNFSTFKTYASRSDAATKQIPLEEFAKVLLMINKKRGYKSSRKAKNQDEGQLIDGMEIARKLYDENLTPGQFVFQLLKEGKKYIPEFYRSDLQLEFDRIWLFQKSFYPEILTDTNKESLTKTSKSLTRDLFQKKLNIDLAEIKGKDDRKLKPYEWRVLALTNQISINELAYVLAEINNQINNSSGYLGSISDRSKELYFNNITIGQYLYHQVKQSPHARLKGQVFYRQDYLDEFDKVWEVQAKYHKQLTPELKAEVRDIIIFFQRKLKTQKGLISFCQFESKPIEVLENGRRKVKTRGMRVSPRSSPLFQEFKIWQILNNVEVTHKKTREKRLLDFEERKILYSELSIRPKLSKSETLKLLFKNSSELDLNYKDIDGNRTRSAIFEAFKKIVEISGHDVDFDGIDATQTSLAIKNVFEILGINTSILSFDSSLDGKALEDQPMFQLWHLIYSYEDDNSPTGNQRLLSLLKEKYGLEKEYALIISNVSLSDDYSNLSSKAIRKILPYLKEGNSYDVACALAGYNHSSSLTRKQRQEKVLKDKLEILERNSLRNPVVEKILNQMVNVVNAVIDEFGKPDEIRLELARELKKNAEERKELNESNIKAKDDHEKLRSTLQSEFGLTYVSRKDIIRYKLYLELRGNGFKTLYSNTYINPAQLFSKEFDVDHIIPQSRLFDDSFSNKTLELKSHNIEKGNRTAHEYVKEKYGDDGLEQYKQRVASMYRSAKNADEHDSTVKSKDPRISKAKHNKLLMLSSEIPEGFIDRDIRDTQYIARKAKTMLEECFKAVVSTTGSITQRLREDWQLVDVLQELNWGKYKALGLTFYETNREGNKLGRITGWTKRNDHRHHAMDALTVAFTKLSHIQYLNNLNARSDKAGSFYGIEQKELYRDERNRLRFKPPIPLDDFRNEARQHLENTLVSFKARNKVTTKNKNKYKIKDQSAEKTELTPRGQLHLETVYGSMQQYFSQEEKINGSFDEDKINKVSRQIYKVALFARLKEFGGDPKKAFAGKNSLDKRPVYLNNLRTQKVPEKIKLVWQAPVYTIRKNISPELFKDSKKNDDFTNRVEDIFDKAVKDTLSKHYAQIKHEVDEFNQSVSKEKEKKKVLETAFSNLDERPIWLNKEKGIKIKRVTVKGINTVLALHDKRNKDGQLILDENGNKIPVDFVNTGNNHHVAIYKDRDGALHECIVSFYEALERVNQGLPVVDKTMNQGEGWQFLFTIKQNEYFVFPNEKTGFVPSEVNMFNRSNYHLISPNLFRVQKIGSLLSGFWFRHHLETTVEVKKELKGITFKVIQSLKNMDGAIKVRINHIGKIVQVGEY